MSRIVHHDDADANSDADDDVGANYDDDSSDEARFIITTPRIAPINVNANVANILPIRPHLLDKPHSLAHTTYGYTYLLRPYPNSPALVSNS